MSFMTQPFFQALAAHASIASDAALARAKFDEALKPILPSIPSDAARAYLTDPSRPVYGLLQDLTDSRMGHKSLRPPAKVTLGEQVENAWRRLRGLKPTTKADILSAPVREQLIAITTPMEKAGAALEDSRKLVRGAFSALETAGTTDAAVTKRLGGTVNSFIQEAERLGGSVHGEHLGSALESKIARTKVLPQLQNMDTNGIVRHARAIDRVAYLRDVHADTLVERAAAKAGPTFQPQSPLMPAATHFHGDPLVGLATHSAPPANLPSLDMPPTITVARPAVAAATPAAVTAVTAPIPVAAPAITLKPLSERQFANHRATKGMAHLAQKEALLGETVVAAIAEKAPKPGLLARAKAFGQRMMNEVRQATNLTNPPVVPESQLYNGTVRDGMQNLANAEARIAATAPVAAVAAQPVVKQAEAAVAATVEKAAAPEAKRAVARVRKTVKDGFFPKLADMVKGNKWKFIGGAVVASTVAAVALAGDHRQHQLAREAEEGQQRSV